MKAPAALVHGTADDPAADIAILNQLSAVRSAHDRRAAAREGMLRLLQVRETAVERLASEIAVERKDVATAGTSNGQILDADLTRARLVEREQALEQARMDLAVTIASTTPEIRAAEDELASLEQRARRLAGGLSEEASRIYASLSRVRRPPFAATLKDDCCDGCNMRLPSSFLGEIRRLRKLHRCPFCKRVVSISSTASR
jgi:predicted  nucleic acid-binding Zn-ribbon protein